MGFIWPALAQEKAPERITVIRDAETETLLRKFADPLFRAANLDSRLVRITLVRDRAINAFVSTGNRMFINTGLIQQAGSALEVIGTMAHETGHVSHGDITRMPDAARNALLQALATMLIAAAAGAASGDASVGMGGMMGGTAMMERSFMAFSRGQETGADQAGLNFLDKLHWSARGMLTLFQKLRDEEALIISRQDPYLITHPLTQDRLDYVARHVDTSPYSDAPLPAGLDGGFRMVQAKLNGFLDPPAKVLRANPESDRAAPARYARAIALHRLGHSADAVRILGGLIAEQPGNPWFAELKGQVQFESGHAVASIAAYQDAARLAPDQALIRQSLGQVLIEANDPAMLRPAVDALQAAQRLDREDEGTWHLLGIAWGRLGDIGQANLALAEEAMLQDDIPTARRFARQAAEALPVGPAKLRALDISNAVKKENRP